MKKINSIFLLGAAVLLLAGCGKEQNSAEYIGIEAARNYALRDAGYEVGQVVFTETEREIRNGLEYYEVDFFVDGKPYEYDIDALTGVVIEKKQFREDIGQATGLDVAGQEDVAHPSGGSAGGVVQSEAVAGNEEKAAEDSPKPKMIGEAKAKSIALAHAGVAEDKVIFVKAGLDRDDGRQVYDLEFYTADHKEYDYEIDPYSGEILDVDSDAEYYDAPQKPEQEVVDKKDPEGYKDPNGNVGQATGNADAGSSSTISAEKAKEIALAQVPGATGNDIREFKTDYDDGRLQYEGKIYYDKLEYEFEIDGYSGAIRDWDLESIYD